MVCGAHRRRAARRCPYPSRVLFHVPRVSGEDQRCPLGAFGFQRTRVQLWVDPALDKSIHHIEAEGACGTLKIDLENSVEASDGRTSLLTAMSVVRAVQNRVTTLRIWRGNSHS